MTNNQDEQNSLIQVIEDEQNDDFSNDDLFNITSWGADMSFRELINMYEDGELIKPELQRKYVWDKAEASRFIESILLWLPIPSIFLAKTKNQNRLIIDGYQRIMTVYDFVQKWIFSKDEKVFKLLNTDKINERWRWKAFNELEDFEQKKIKQTTIHAIIFEQTHPRENDSSLFQVFERINTSGRTLKAQEIRNCVYQGFFNSLLIKLNQNPIWRKLFWNINEDPRMADMEYILRFFALSDEKLFERKAQQISLKLYLNEYMGRKEHQTESFLTSKEAEFLKIIEKLNYFMWENIFRNISNLESNETYINKFHPTIYDSIMIATKKAFDNDVNFEQIQDFWERHKKLLSDPNYKTFTTIRTTNLENIRGRINLAWKILYEMDC